MAVKNIFLIIEKNEAEKNQIRFSFSLEMCNGYFGTWPHQEISLLFEIELSFFLRKYGIKVGLNVGLKYKYTLISQLLKICGWVEFCDSDSFSNAYIISSEMPSNEIVKKFTGC